MTSLHRDGRSLVAVVLGGRTAAARDAYMEGLIRDHFAQASDRGHTAPMIAEAAAPPGPPVKLASLAVPPGAIPAPPARSAAGPDRGRRRGLRRRSDARAAPRARRRRRDEVRRRCARRQARRPDRRRPRLRAAACADAVAAATPQQLGWVKGPDPVAKGPSRDVALAAALGGPSQSGHHNRRRDRARADRSWRLDHPDRHLGRRRQGQRPARPRARPEPWPARSGAAVHRESRQGRRHLLSRPLRWPRLRRAPRPPAARSRRAVSPVSPRATEERHPCRSRTSLASLTCAAKAVDPPWSG